MLRRLTLAAVTDEFHQKMSRLKHFLVYRTPAFKRGKKYLSLISVKDPQDPEDPGYFYVQRLGRDSVAFLLYDSSGEHGGDNTYNWGVLEQYHSPIKRWVKGAFTGSMDKPDLDATAICVEEVIEEAGFKVTPDRITEVAYLPVGANTNEQVHLFVVDVTGLPQDKAEPENIFEANTNIYWYDEQYVLQSCEWKAQLILLHSGKLADPGALV